MPCINCAYGDNAPLGKQDKEGRGLARLQPDCACALIGEGRRRGGQGLPTWSSRVARSFDRGGDMQIVCARRDVTRLALMTLLVSLTPTAGRANSFTPGNLVIYRVGDGSAGLANTGNAIFLDEYNPTAQMVVNSIEMPTAPTGNNQPLIASGTSVSEGLLTRSADGRYIVLTGYATTMSTSGSLSSSPASMVPRGIGRVDSEGNVDTSTVLGDFADGNNPRSATSTDGASFWVAGADADSAARYTM